MGRLVSKFFIYDNMTPNKASSHHFTNMMLGAQSLGNGIELPSPYEIKKQVLGNGTQRYERTCSRSERKMVYLWVHYNGKWLD